jgi:hypothetical protein
MKLEDFEKLKLRLEVFKLEKNFFALDRVLYYFSFLGNIFLIYFGYFFIKSTVDGIPDLFPYQDQFLTIFVALFLIGYELTKRFVVEQSVTAALQKKGFSTNILGGMLVSLALIAGSFYLSLNGAHRLIDTSDKIEQAVDDKTSDKVAKFEQEHDDRVASYKKEIESYQQRIDRVMNPAEGRALYRSERETIKGWEERIQQLRQEIKSEDARLEELVAKAETKTDTGAEREKEKVAENDTAFVFMTFFLEFIVILGVGFNAYYVLGSYDETKKLLETPKYKQLDLNIKLLKLYYQGGKKNPGDPAMSASKLLALVKTQKIQCNYQDVRNFVVLCTEIDVIKEASNNKKIFQVPYDQAKKLIMKDDLL